MKFKLWFWCFVPFVFQSWSVLVSFLVYKKQFICKFQVFPEAHLKEPLALKTPDSFHAHQKSSKGLLAEMMFFLLLDYGPVLTGTFRSDDHLIHSELKM